MSKAPSTDRLPPHSPEAEQGVLGCVLLEPKDCLVTCAEKFGECQVFYDLRHEEIYFAMRRMSNEGEQIDIITLQQRLKDVGMLEKVGGLAYLSKLPDTVPLASNIENYADIVWEKYQLRTALATLTQCAGNIWNATGDVDAVLSEIESHIFNLPRAKGTGARAIGQYAMPCVERFEHYARGIGTMYGLPTGFRYWDKLSGGLQNNELICIGGRPSTGKTSLVMGVAERIAMDGGNPVGVISLEMSALDLTQRLACSRSRANFHKLRTGMASKKELEALVTAMPKIQKAPIYIDDESSLTIFEIRSRLRSMKQRWGIRAAIVDYLQLAALPKEYRTDKIAGYGEVAKGLKASAKELGIPIIVLSQLNREGEKRGGIPRMSDLRESGDIEAAADFIGILYREKLSEEDEESLRDAINNNPMDDIQIPMLMEVCKNRNGPSGTAIQFDFMRWCMRFEDKQNPTKPDPLPSDDEIGR